MNRLALVASTFLLAAGPALALDVPRPCSAAEPRVRCIPYNPAQVVQLYGAPGAAMTVEFGDSETIIDASVSDNGLMQGGPSSNRETVQVSQTGGATADRNMQMAKRGPFLFLKPLRHLDPQPIIITTRREDGKMRRYVFQMETREGPLTADAPNTFYSIRFTYPSDEAEARRARWAAQQEQREARAAAARLRQNTIAGETLRNTAYEGRGTAKDRAALAPKSVNGEPAMWDDGQRTYLRYPGNHRVPMVYRVMPDGQEALIGQSVDADPTTNGTLVTLHAVVPMLRLRDGNSVLCITNKRPDPIGVNPGTGTTSADVVREVQPQGGRPVVR